MNDTDVTFSVYYFIDEAAENLEEAKTLTSYE